MLELRHVVPALLLLAAASLAAQDKSEFDVVSIKRHAGDDRAIGVRTLPDGTTMITNLPINVALGRMAPVPLRDVIGLPEWVNTERYDITAKPPASTPPAQQKPMWAALFADRMKLVAHDEQRERDMYALMLARSDGKLGPQLTPSTLDCASPPAPLPFTPGQPPPTIEKLAQILQQRCGVGIAGRALVSGGVTLDQLARFLEGSVQAAIENRTGLDGRYAFTLTFSRSSPNASIERNAADDVPDIFTAMQEQLGLKLEHGKKVMPVLVIDRIERPSEN
ncbi:MAG TPA: TIGR03435 family protein [Vicinamibacterales bacterium]|nr:TIGR03435 family protein [Vicinamibacterales bacterium]